MEFGDSTKDQQTPGTKRGRTPRWTIAVLHDDEEFGSPERLGRFLKGIRQWFRVVSLSEGLSLLSCGSTRPLFSLTFDDGDRSVRDVLPALAELGVPACLFVATDFIRSGERRKHGRVRAAMSRLQLSEWVSAGLDVGGHTVSHPRLTELSDDRIREEVLGGCDTLEAWIGGRVEHFAYPYGAWDARVREVVAGLGRFRTASAVRAESARPGSDVFSLPRLKVRANFAEVLRLRFFPVYRGARARRRVAAPVAA